MSTKSTEATVPPESPVLPEAPVPPPQPSGLSTHSAVYEEQARITLASILVELKEIAYTWSPDTPFTSSDDKFTSNYEISGSQKDDCATRDRTISDTDKDMSAVFRSAKEELTKNGFFNSMKVPSSCEKFKPADLPAGFKSIEFDGLFHVYHPPGQTLNLQKKLFLVYRKPVKVKGEKIVPPVTLPVTLLKTISTGQIFDILHPESNAYVGLEASKNILELLRKATKMERNATILKAKKRQVEGNDDITIGQIISFVVFALPKANIYKDAFIDFVWKNATAMPLLNELLGMKRVYFLDQGEVDATRQHMDSFSSIHKRITSASASSRSDDPRIQDERLKQEKLNTAYLEKKHQLQLESLKIELENARNIRAAALTAQLQKEAGIQLEAGVLGKRKRGDGEDGEAEAEDE
jgi:hypothetical protein